MFRTRKYSSSGGGLYRQLERSLDHKHLFAQDQSEQVNNQAIHFTSPSLPPLLPLLPSPFSPFLYSIYSPTSLIFSPLFGLPFYTPLSFLLFFLLPFHRYCISADTSLTNFWINSSRKSRPMFSVCTFQIHYKNYCRKNVLF